MSIFVFGSNLGGKHGKGAALHAHKFEGAIYGRGCGRQGNSYAIPTKGYFLDTLPLDQIKLYIEIFFEYATWHPLETFNVTRIGCGLAGYTDEDIGPIFAHCPDNCILPEEWKCFQQE